MPRGGARPNAGRRRVEKPPSVADKNAAAKLIEVLNKPPGPHDSEEIKGWRSLWNAQDLRIKLDTRKYLYDKRDGKPVQTVNHLHDKPIEMNVTHSMAEIVREVRQRKAEYERSRN